MYKSVKNTENKKRIICFIPARSGSTRIKNKNIMNINERPLIYWTVLKAIKSKKFNKIIISSDSNKYYKILINYLKKDRLNYKNLIFDKRIVKYSKTKSKIFDYIKSDLINKFDLSSDDLLVQLLPTCPLRSVNSIVKAIRLSLKNKINIFSVSEYDFHVNFAISITDLKWRPKFENSPLITGNTQSQSQKKYYHPNGVINCMFVKNLNLNKKSIYIDAHPMVVPKLEAFDINTKEDFKLLKVIVKNSRILNYK